VYYDVTTQALRYLLTYAEAQTISIRIELLIFVIFNSEEWLEQFA